MPVCIFYGLFAIRRTVKSNPPSHLLYRQFAARAVRPAPFVVLGEGSLNIRMRGQQVLP